VRREVISVSDRPELSDGSRDRCPEEELRLALVMNGGVSLAVWMGGTGLEIDRLTRAGMEKREISALARSLSYEAILDFVRSTVRVDVIAGTSAGGINGAALAVSQSNVNADLAVLRNLWAEQGGMEELLRQPFQGQPASLLRGDEYFLPQLNAAMRRLARDPKPWKEKESPPIDLTLMTTLLVGTTKVTVDALGQQIPDVEHSGAFRFREDAFRPEKLMETARALGLAARSSASYPIAFEPSFVPAAGQTPPGQRGPDADLRPDMKDYGSWSKGRTGNLSRFVVDGGVLANTPTRAALDAINRMDPEGPLRRAMVLVHPHAPAAMQDIPDDQAVPPNAVRTMARILGALTAQGSRNFVAEITSHNRVAAGWRGGRTEILVGLQSINDLDDLVRRVWPHFQRLQIRLAACGLAKRLPEDRLARGWSVDRVADAAMAAMEYWRDEEGSLPFLPAERPGVGNGLDGVRAGEGGWAWGRTAARGVVDAVADVLRRAMSVADKVEAPRIKKAREELCEARNTINRAAAEIESVLVEPIAEPRPCEWYRRMQAYDGDMRGDASSQVGNAGSQIGAAVRDVCAALLTARDVLLPIAGDPERGPIAELGGWQTVLDLSDVAPDDHERTLLARLLSLDVATTMVADQRPASFGLPIDLVQLSLQAVNPFAEMSTSPDDKAAGLDLSRFGGFLKRSWRVNDWIWGRLDAATVLCTTVLSPDRVRRVALLRGLAGDAGADTMFDELCASLFPEGFPAHLDGQRAEARAELRQLLRTDRPAADHGTAAIRAELPSALFHLADLCAWALHSEIILDELPFLVGAIRADAVEGAPRGSNGAIFLAENEKLIDDVARLGTGPPVDRCALALRALKAFDRAGIGRESLRDEAAGDQLIRTAATATAVAATVLDSDRSGLGLLRPLTRVLRGIALLPFWVIAGLTRGGSLARYLALFGLAVGGLFLVLSLTGGLPAWLAGPAALGGGGAVLAALGYSALRSGTILHGVVLLGPVAALVELAIEGAMTGRPPTPAVSGAAAATFGFETLLLGVAVVLGLIFLGSLPAPEKSPLGLLKTFLAVVRTAFAKPSPQEAQESGLLRRALRQPTRIAAPARSATIKLARRVLPTLAAESPPPPVVSDEEVRRSQARRLLILWSARLAVAAAVVGLVIVFAHNLEALGELIPVSLPTALKMGAALVVCCGIWVTAAGRGFQRWVRATEAEPWKRQSALHRAVVAASWSYVYGVGYLLVAVGILRVVPAPGRWLQATVVACVLLGWLLASAVPVVVLVRARARLVRDLVTEISTLPSACDLQKTLEQRGATYAFLVRPAHRASGSLHLTAGGQDLQKAAIADRQSPHRSGIPVSIHLIAAALSVLSAMTLLAVGALPAAANIDWLAAALIALVLAASEGVLLVCSRSRASGMPGALTASILGAATVLLTLGVVAGEKRFAVAVAHATVAAVLLTTATLVVVALVRGLVIRLAALVQPEAVPAAVTKAVSVDNAPVVVGGVFDLPLGTGRPARASDEPLSSAGC
jgi:patatin-related protein